MNGFSTASLIAAAGCILLVVSFCILSQRRRQSSHGAFAPERAAFLRVGCACITGLVLVVVIALLFPSAFTPAALLVCSLALLCGGLAGEIIFPRPAEDAASRDKIRSFTENLRAYRSVSPLLDELAVLLTKTLKIERFQLTLYTPSTKEVSACRTVPESLASAVPAPDYNGALLQHLQSHAGAWFDLSDLPTFAGTEPTAASNLRNGLSALDPVVCIPLKTGDDILGILILGDKSDGDTYTTSDLDVLVELCRQIGTFIDQLRLQDRLGMTEKLESLAIMSRGLAHDLNNLLTPINTYIQLTGSRPSPDDPDGELLQLASKNIAAIRTYVREAVFFSTTLAPKIEPIPVNALTEGLASICAHQLGQKNVTLGFDLPKPFVLHGDATLLQRLLANLVFNANDASPAGASITVRIVELPRVSGRPSWIRLQVIDHGTGIPPENIDRVFAPYFTTKDHGDQTRGFGLGLTICQKIVHLHRGTITMRSALGRGTTVQIDLPADPGATPACNQNNITCFP